MQSLRFELFTAFMAMAAMVSSLGGSACSSPSCSRSSPTSGGTRPSPVSALACFPAGARLRPGSLSCSSSSLLAGVQFQRTLARVAGLPRAAGQSSGLMGAVARWVLEPVGDGDSSHLEEEVEKPGAISLEGEAFVVGRASDRSDIVLPVPTVSGSHARLEKKGVELFVTDLNSTNGTFVNDQPLRPGTLTPLAEGSVVVFGDQHLAMFKVVQVPDA